MPISRQRVWCNATVHVLVAITAHGFGHAAQVAPVLNALRKRVSDVRLTLLSSLPPAYLQGRIQGGFEQIKAAPDFGLVMNSALDINLDASAAAYRDLHDDWAGRVRHEANRLERLAPDLVLADVPYLTLAAAAQAGIPALALCSLNWADIYRHYFAGRPEAPRVLAQMEDAYQSAQAFLCPEPSMPMPFLNNRMALGTIAALGEHRGKALRQQLGIGADQALILVAPGGVKARFPIEAWPAGQGIHWLVDADWQVQHPDVSAYQDSGFDFTDLVASCDAVLGKCGYGTVAECVANGTPLMYIPRPDWPEEASLLAWLQTHNAGLAVGADRLVSGDFGYLPEALDAFQVTVCRPDGAEQAADRIVEQFN
jgi:hypothetical protein